MPPATSTSVPAAAMISVADCWSRMLSRLSRVAKCELFQRQRARRGRRTGSGSPSPRSARPSRAARATSRTRARRACSRGRHRARPRTRRARIAFSVISPPASSATIRPRRMTSTRWARPSTSSSSDEIRITPRPVARRARPGSRRSRAWRRRRRRASARRRSARCGSQSSVRASSTFCWLPPDSVCTGAPKTRRARRSARASRGAVLRSSPRRTTPGARARRAARASCSRSTERPKSRPSSLRDSGTSASPPRQAAARAAPEPACRRRARPSRPTASPRRRAPARAPCAPRRRAPRCRRSRLRARSKLASSTPGRRHAVDREHAGASAAAAASPGTSR